MSISYLEALNSFGPSPVFELGNVFRCRLVDPRFDEGGVSVRVEVLFKQHLMEFNQPGDLTSIRSGALDLAVLVDQKVIAEEQLPAVLEYLQNWNADQMYKKGTEKSYIWVIGGTLSGDILEFNGPNGITCAGLVNVVFSEGRIALKGLAVGGQRGSEEARAAIRKHLGTRPTNTELVF